MPQGLEAPARVSPRDRSARLQSGRWALWTPVAMGMGIMAYFAMLAEPPPEAGWGAGVAAVVGLALSSRLDRGRVATITFALIALGFAIAVWHAHTAGTPVIKRAMGPVEVTARVVDSFRHRDGRPRVLLEPTAIGSLQAAERPRYIRLALKKTDAMPQVAQWVSVTARLSTLPSPVAPGSYDFARAAYFDGIGAYGFAMSALRPVPPASDLSVVDEALVLIAELRQVASERIHAALPGSTGAIAAALTIGDRSEISEEDDEALRDSSLAHVLSISGLHMAIIGLGVFGSLRLFGALIPAIALRFDVKKWAAAAALLASAVYLGISGASVPAQRSFIMIGLMFVAVLLERAPFNLRIVAIAAVLILLIAPESVVDPSFQMSFAAVVALISGFEAFEAWQVRRGDPLVLRDTWTGRILYALVVAILASLLAGFATAPYAAYHFNRVAAYGVVANLATAPLVSFVIMPFVGLTLVALPLGLEAWPLAVVGWGIDLMLAVAHEVASWPGAAFHVPSWPAWSLGLVTLGGLWMALWRGRVRLAGLGFIAVAILVGLATPAPDILVDRDAKNVAVRDAEGRFALVSGRRAQFAAEEWLQRDGDDRSVRDAARAGRETVWTCKDKICSAHSAGHHIGYMERAGNARAACERNFDILIAARDIDPCASGLTMSLRDTSARGAMALVIYGHDIAVHSVRDVVGDRPWTIWPDQ